MTAPVPDDFDLYLASRSPRRCELLDQIGVRYRVLPADVVERRESGETPGAYVRRVAVDKARAALARSAGDRPVLGADTDVILDDVVLGKPTDEADGRAMLAALSGRTHEVLSAVAVALGGRVESRLQVNRVTFGELAPETITSYWATGEPVGKAGAYAIQGRGGAFVARLEGSFSGVMGLPLFETAALLRAFAIDPLRCAA